MQRRRQAHDGSVGPLDIEHPRLQRLLLLFLAKPGAKVDWETVGRKWRSEYPELRLARLVEKLQRGGQARVIWRKLEGRMTMKDIPLR